MTKSELFTLLAERANIPKKQAEHIVNLIFNSMTDSLVKNERIEIRGFGSFIAKHYEAYQGRNPRTGEITNVKEKRLPFFKVGKELRQKVDYGDKG